MLFYLILAFLDLIRIKDLFQYEGVSEILYRWLPIQIKSKVGGE